MLEKMMWEWDEQAGAIWWIDTRDLAMEIQRTSFVLKKVIN